MYRRNTFANKYKKDLTHNSDAFTKVKTLRFHLTAAAMKEEQNPFISSEEFFAYLKEWSNSLKPVVVK
jgi:hypothetical protein